MDTRNAVSLSSFYSSLLLFLFFLIFPISASLAFDNAGCLTCHQYPGLVRLENTGRIKPLHIDEQLYNNSAHGKLGCRDCHTGVDKIPHDGANQTQCGNDCHTGEDKKLLTAQHRKTIHKGQHSYITRLEDQTSCKVCHNIYPHTDEPFVRAMLNMHTGYIVCEVCHLDRDRFSNIKYDWVDNRQVSFEGKPFFNFYDPHKQATRSTGRKLSRIAAFIQRNGKLVNLMNTKDRASAEQYLSNKGNKLLTKNDAAFEVFHKHIGTMDSITVCETCHSANGLLNFKQLGFDNNRTKELMNLNIQGIVSKYKTFYMPGVFGQ